MWASFDAEQKVIKISTYATVFSAVSTTNCDSLKNISYWSATTLSNKTDNLFNTAVHKL